VHWAPGFGDQFSHRNCHPDRGNHGPTQGGEKPASATSSPWKRPLAPLSSRPERSAVEGPAVLRLFPGNVFRRSEPGFPPSQCWQRDLRVLAYILLTVRKRLSWLPKKSSCPLDAAPEPYYCESRIRRRSRLATMALLGVALARSARASASNHPKHQRSRSMPWVLQTAR
jgi:hypothetical protein